MIIYYFQHVPFEGPAMIGDWAKERGHTLQGTKLYDAAPVFPPAGTVPQQDAKIYDALVILGGPMSIHDEQDYPWLAEEKEHIRHAVDSGKPVLGICLGAQLIAHVLGAEVAPHKHKEIGWYPVQLTAEAAAHHMFSGLPHNLTVLHWHGDRFTIPEDAIPVASSIACDNQGFIYNDRILGLQFHLEMHEEAVKNIIHACGNELAPGGPYVQSAQAITEGLQKHTLRDHVFTLLDNWSE